MTTSREIKHNQSADIKIDIVEDLITRRVRAATYNMERTDIDTETYNYLRGEKSVLIDIAKKIGLDLKQAVEEGLNEAENYNEKIS